MVDSSVPIHLFLERYSARIKDWAEAIRLVSSTDDGEARSHEPGKPWIDPESIETSEEQASKFFSELLGDLQSSSQEPAPDLDRIQSLISKNEIAPLDLLQAVIRRDTKRIDKIAEKGRLPSQLLHFLGAYLARPFLSAAVKGLDLQSLGVEAGNASCPGCGHDAALALLMTEDGQRRLWCRHCAIVWPVRRLKCPSCGNTDADTLGYFTLEEDTGRRVDFCRKCKCYLKTLDLRGKAREYGSVQADLEDLLSSDLDVAAVREGFLPMSKAAPAKNDDR